MITGNIVGNLTNFFFLKIQIPGGGYLIETLDENIKLLS